MTPSERYLAKLCDRSFMNLWSYPNTFIDRGRTGKGDGKELCDLLVVCGDDILIFSDKTIGWPLGDDINLSWKRWYNRAIASSVKQIRGAERWLNKFPDKIFIDKSCTQPFPFELPPIERRRIHGIVVALGAGLECQKYFGEGRGSLYIVPEINGANNIPFCVGDIDPSESFIHILDDATLDIVLRELDTIADFTAYLKKKVAFIRAGNLISAGGEEDLVAHFMSHMNAEDDHDFVLPDGSMPTPNHKIVVAPGAYDVFIEKKQYIDRKKADEVSYVWDRIITQFTDTMIAGTSIMDSREFVLSEGEQCVRHLALVSRFGRRMYGRGIIEAFEKGRNAPRFTRSFLPGNHSREKDTAFYFMTLALPAKELAVDYDKYRSTRRSIAEVFGLALLQKFPALKRVIGIGCEPAGSSGSSEDLMLLEGVVWNDELLLRLEKRKEFFGIMQEGNLVEQLIDEWEYPPSAAQIPSAQAPRGNRRQRRARASRDL